MTVLHAIRAAIHNARLDNVDVRACAVLRADYEALLSELSPRARVETYGLALDNTRVPGVWVDDVFVYTREEAGDVVAEGRGRCAG